MRMIRQFCFFVLLLCSTISYAEELESSSKIKELISHVEHSIAQAERGISKLNTAHLAIEGMSSPRVRHFLNNLCSLKDSSYLEIGCWKGSTLVAAAYENLFQQIVAIENWSEFQGPRHEFFNNIYQFLPAGQVNVLEADCFSVNTSTAFTKPVNIYFYDGNHSKESHKNAFVYYSSIFEDVFIAVVDDWNWECVRDGTYEAFAELGFQVVYSRVLPARWNGDAEQWWNGLYVAIIHTKPNK